MLKIEKDYYNPLWITRLGKQGDRSIRVVAAGVDPWDYDYPTREERDNTLASLLAEWETLAQRQAKMKSILKVLAIQGDAYNTNHLGCIGACGEKRIAVIALGTGPCRYEYESAQARDAVLEDLIRDWNRALRGIESNYDEMIYQFGLLLEQIGSTPEPDDE